MAQLITKPEQISRDHFLLKIDAGFKQIPETGQFVNIRISSGTDPLIRIPISVFNFENGILELVIRLAGPGTGLICSMNPGPVDILGPLGHGFTVPENSKVLLAGGGVGNAPLYYLAKELKKHGNEITYIYGSRSKEYIFLEDRYRATADSFYIMTDDGSAGDRGFVPAKAEELYAECKYDHIFTCGPSPMMQALSQSAPAGTEIHVSMENYFACGLGMCAGCTVETTEGLKRVCAEGPVMDGRKILWHQTA